MGFGELAAMMYLNNEANRESQNADSLRDGYNKLVYRFRDLQATNAQQHTRINELIDEVNKRIQYAKEDRLHTNKVYVERNGLLAEVADLKKKVASQSGLSTEVVALRKKVAEHETFMLKQNAFVTEAKTKNTALVGMVASRDQDIKNLTSRNESLTEEVEKKELQLSQRVYVLEAIRRGVHEIPVEHRIKALAMTYMRYPDVSQASLDTKMPDNMKKDIESYMTMALISESGKKRAGIMNLYDTAKGVVGEEIAAERKVFLELIEIRKAMVQKAQDNGEDISKIPDIWTIQANMKSKSESEAIASSQEVEEEESLKMRPR